VVRTIPITLRLWLEFLGCYHMGAVTPARGTGRFPCALSGLNQRQLPEMKTQLF